MTGLFLPVGQARRPAGKISTRMCPKSFLVRDLGYQGAWHLDALTVTLTARETCRLAREPLLQTGQARLGAPVSGCRRVACKPCAPVGQADWGRVLERPTGLFRSVRQVRRAAGKISTRMCPKAFLVRDLGDQGAWHPDMLGGQTEGDLMFRLIRGRSRVR